MCFSTDFTDFTDGWFAGRVRLACGLLFVHEWTRMDTNENIDGILFSLLTVGNPYGVEEVDFAEVRSKRRRWSFQRRFYLYGVLCARTACLLEAGSLS